MEAMAVLEKQQQFDFQNNGIEQACPGHLSLPSPAAYDGHLREV